MADNSKIEWTTHTFNPWSFRVFLVVASLTQGNAIRYIKSKLGMISERFDVMSSQVAAAIVSTLLTSKLITHKNIEAPALVITAEALIAPFGKLAVFVAVTGFALQYLLGCTQGATNLSSFLKRAWLPFSWIGLAFACFAHFTPRIWRMLLAFECRDAPLGTNPLFYVTALKTSGIPPIMAGSVLSKVESNILPLPAARTPLLAVFDFGKKLIKRNSGFLRCNFQCTIFGLCHFSAL